jgi:hypothetical protein
LISVRAFLLGLSKTGSGESSFFRLLLGEPASDLVGLALEGELDGEPLDGDLAAALAKKDWMLPLRSDNGCHPFEK